MCANEWLALVGHQKAMIGACWWTCSGFESSFSESTGKNCAEQVRPMWFTFFLWDRKLFMVSVQAKSQHAQTLIHSKDTNTNSRTKALTYRSTLSHAHSCIPAKKHPQTPSRTLSPILKRQFTNTYSQINLLTQTHTLAWTWMFSLSLSHSHSLTVTLSLSLS